MSNKRPFDTHGKRRLLRLNRSPTANWVENIGDLARTLYSDASKFEKAKAAGKVVEEPNRLLIEMTSNPLIEEVEDGPLDVDRNSYDKHWKIAVQSRIGR